MDCSRAGIGHRVYEIRRALGPDARHEMPQRRFAELLNEQARGLFPLQEERPAYDSSIIARMERGERGISVQDIVVVASVDPEGRGKLWLGWGEKRDPMLVEKPIYLGKIPDEAAETASRARAAKLAAKRAAEDPPARKVSGGRRRKGHPRDGR